MEQNPEDIKLVHAHPIESYCDTATQNTLYGHIFDNELTKVKRDYQDIEVQDFFTTICAIQTQICAIQTRVHPKEEILT